MIRRYPPSPWSHIPFSLLAMLAACAPMPSAPTGVEGPSLRPGQSFGRESGHHLTLSGDYGLPAGTYAVVFTCFGEVGYRIDTQSGTRNGKCKVTGLSNSVIEHGISGPGTLGIAIDPVVFGGTSFVNVQLSLP